MPVEHRSKQDPGGRKWKEVYRDGVFVQREPLPVDQQPAKVALEMSMARRWELWHAWFTTLEEAQGRGVPVAVRNAMEAAELQAWDALIAAVMEWYAEPAPMILPALPEP